MQGEKYSETIKEKLLTYFRILCEKISPDIVKSQLYKLEFVPIKDAARNGWEAGMFVVRFKVQRGSKHEMYSFKSDGTEVFAFRTENEVLCKRMGQEILELYRQRLNSNDDGGTHLKHPGPCRPVEMGKQIFEYDNPNRSVPLPWD